MAENEDAHETDPLLSANKGVEHVIPNYTANHVSQHSANGEVEHVIPNSTASVSQRVSPYAIYVVVILTLGNVLNQLCRFVLISTNQSMAEELKFGDKKCIVSNASALENYLHENNINGSGADYCRWNHGARCNSLDLRDFCKWRYTGTGIQYELLVGPLFMVVLSFTGIPVSLVSEARSLKRKNILSLCVLCFSVATVMTGWATQYWQVAVARMALALFEAPYLTFASSLAACYFAKKHRSVVIGTVSSAVFIGYGSAFLLALLDDTFGWRWTYWLSGIPGLAISILLFITVKELKPETQNRNNKKKKVNIAENLHQFKSPIHILLLLATAVRNGAGYVIAYNINNYFNNYYPDYPVEVFMTWSPMVSGCLGTLLGGILADRLSRRWGTIGRLFVIILSSVSDFGHDIKLDRINKKKQNRNYVAITLRFTIIFTCLLDYMFLAAPIFVGFLRTSPPGAFYWFLIGSTISELWLGVGLSVVIDIAPAQVVTSCLAVYYFTYTFIGGNINLLVTPMTDACGWRCTMQVLVVSCFLVSGVLFTIVACLLKLKSSRTVSENNRGVST